MGHVSDFTIVESYLAFFIAFQFYLNNYTSDTDGTREQFVWLLEN